MAEGGVLNILVFGAHPDDPDSSSGGIAALYSQRGHRVKFVSLTNGDAGHHEIGDLPWLDASQTVGDAVNFGGRNIQSQCDIVESAGANPADAVLHGPKVPISPSPASGDASSPANDPSKPSP